MNKPFLTILLIIITVLSISTIFSTPLARATSLQENLKKTGGQAYYNDSNKAPNETDPAVIVGRIIKAAMGFLGLLFTILILISGFQWMTAGGNTEVITKARNRMVNASIGLVIVLGIFGITAFIISKAFSVTGF